MIFVLPDYTGKWVNKLNGFITYPGEISMPAPDQEILLAPSQTTIVVGLEPAQNIFHSLVLLAKAKSLGGFDDWIVETRQAMTVMERQRHSVVMLGFYYAVEPEGRWPSFPDYINHLERMTPVELRDKLLRAYIELPCCIVEESKFVEFNEEFVGEILSSVDAYLAFLEERFAPEHIDTSIETKAYAYLIDPPAMHKMVVNHIKSMWEKYLQVEWKRVKPMLQDAVAAFEQVDFMPMDRLAAAEFITGQTLGESKLRKPIEEAEQVVFVPSAHVGPYLGTFRFEKTLGIIFGARLPEGTLYYAPDLSRAEILVRLNALADDNRLRILRLIAEEGEKRSQEIIHQLDMSQSAASRHLKQLSATGYLVERRCEGAKCYELNTDRLEDTLRAVLTYLTVI
jgi:DNA-binding transcriptional ArsR family regulator